jgi:hypothetical protein
MLGWSTGKGIGVQGYCTNGGGSVPLGVTKTGVYGFADLDTTARGVYGKTTVGQGVRGEATSGVGVHATATTGVALETFGKVKVNRSGKTNVAAGASSVDVTVPGGLSGTPLPFANLQAHVAGVHVEAIRPNYPSTGVMRIYLNKIASTTASTPLSWLVLG